VYFKKGKKKITEQKEILRLNGSSMTLKQRQEIRNRISAQMSRISKKEERIFLNNEIKQKDKKFTDIIKSLLSVINEEQGRELQK
jgi:hypothetical protein